MNYVIKKPILPEHVCNYPNGFLCGVGSVWRCDDQRSLFLNRLISEGCGKHYKLVSTGEWVEVSWPPLPNPPAKTRASSSDAGA